MTPTLRGLTLATALGSTAMGGVFFAFSAFVMPALARLPAAQGIAAMQSINVTAVRAPFMAALFGTAAGCVGLSVHAARHWGGRPAVLLAVGAGLYLVGTIGLTIAYHVPLNDALAALDATSPGSVAEWQSYLSGWTRWNHVRSVLALAAGAALVLALVQPPDDGPRGGSGATARDQRPAPGGRA